jgi:hypothetical protein
MGKTKGGAHLESVKFLVGDFLASVHDGPEVEESLVMIATFVLGTIPEKKE